MEAALEPDKLSATLAAVLARAAPWELDEAARDLAPRFHALKLSRQTAVLRQGEVWTRALLVDSGLVRLHFVQRDGHDYNKNFFAEGSLVCPIAAQMWREGSLFAITTVEATVLWAADARAFRDTLEARRLWLPLRAELLERLVMSKLQRERDLLALDARQRWDVFCSRSPDLAARVPLKHLATYLGMTDVSLSRLRRVKQGKGLRR